jgi:hypothetical protein
VSVGGLLTLDQVLELLGHVQPFLGLQQLVEYEAPEEAEIIGSRATFGPLLGFGNM